MKKLLGILVLGLLWCNVGFASEAGGIREPGTDEKCFYVFERENIFKKKFLPKVKKIKEFLLLILVVINIMMIGVGSIL